MTRHISDHFSRAEFACKCGCGLNTVDTELLMLCEVVRVINGGHGITPSSACRCAEHNAKVGGAETSQHLLGRAADLPVDDPKAVFDRLCELYPHAYGFGLYDGFIHVDSRSKKARWPS